MFILGIYNFEFNDNENNINDNILSWQSAWEENLLCNFFFIV